MRILCQPLVHRQDGIDLIRISIIEPFGQRLLIRESTKHRRGWGNEGAARSQLRPCHCWFPQMETRARASKSLQHPKQHPVMELITNSSSSQPQLLRGDTRQPRSRGDSLGQGAMSSPSCPPLCHNLINQASCLAAFYFFSQKKTSSQPSREQSSGCRELRSLPFIGLLTGPAALLLLLAQRCRGSCRGRGSPGEPGRLQFILINPEQNEEMNWQQQSG